MSKFWPSGPVWFIWVLLAFDGIAALLFAVTPGWGGWFGRVMSGGKRGPWAFFAKLVAISAIAYIPMALVFSPLTWTAFGPFTFQTGRILHYLAYFLIGVGVGAWEMDRGPLALTGLLARRWYVWAIASVLVFVLATVVTLSAFGPKAPSQGLMIAIDAGFVLSCATSSIAFLALFLRFARSRSRAFDSLGANSYAIYLVHYIFVSWLQYALLPASLPGMAKFAVVLFVALALSWGTAAAIRRLPAVARVV
jgi:peptidoglycan/LPS O-acetylase OafA/YrhL